MNLTLTPPQWDDVNEVLAFELGNRAYFESWVNARPDTYYSVDGVTRAIETALLEANEDRAYQYLVRENGVLVGRINFTQVRRRYFHSASLGYRMGADHTGRGLARQAVGLGLKKAFEEHALLRIEATVRPENPGSLRVLERSGFTQYGHSRKSFLFHGQWFDMLHFEIHAQPNTTTSTEVR
ncbi:MULTISPECIES: GNAT family protein [unclassified Pseudomonas]|uniref:GNAT family N-acetyltransferase n=1 Tax=unclassified Pseudomonas TaxID=196821 RepID=UPI0011EFA11C|nr:MULTISPECIES: GNAT family protein [unclassified Pseudomonas]KAA0947079.1 GNAT family N-acetyltransferase [Pseudomonas sp. ANT_H4]KAA0953620.1 GNAT family N-acetyltransferase [Pseudomonas sp. ANT_H14]